MRKLVILVVILLVLGGLVFWAVRNLNGLINRNKDYLLSQAEQALGRKVSVGEIGVTLRNGIGVTLKDFALADDQAFSKKEFVRASDLQVNVKLLPLLSKELQVKRVILHDPVITIIRDRNGRFNFSSIGQKAKAEGKEPEPQKAEPKSAEKKAPPLLLVSLVDISGGEVRYQDRKEGTDLQIKKIDLEVEDLDLGKPFTAELAAALFSDKQNLKLQTTVGPLRPDGDFNQVPLEGELSIDPIDMDKLKSAVPKIKSALPKDLGLGGVFRVRETRLKGTLKNLGFKGTLEGTDGAINFGKTFHKPSGTPLTVTADGQYTGQGIALRQAKVKLHTLEMVGKGEVKLGEVPFINLTLDSNRVTLDGWEKIVPPIGGYQLGGSAEVHTTVRGKAGKGATPQVQGRVNLSGVSATPPQFPQPVKDLNAKIAFTGQSADLKETTMTLGNSEIRLAAQVERFAPLTLTYKISTPELRPADFQASLPEERKADVLKGVTSEGKLVSRDGNPTYRGKVASAQGTLYKIGYKDLAAVLSLENKIADIRSLRVNALNGSVQIDGEYAFDRPTPRFALNSKAQGIDIKELYGALAPKAQRDIRGRLNADMKVFGSGAKWEEIKPNLRGQGKAEVLEGVLMNFNIAEQVLSGITGVPGLASLINQRVREKYPDIFTKRDTEFEEMKSVFILSQGKMNVQNLRITAAEFTTRGKGWLDFDRRVDFGAVLMFSQRLSADLAGSAREVKYIFNDQGRLEIPFVLKGQLPSVKPKPDMSYVGKLLQRGMMQRGLDELRKRFGPKESTPKEGEATPEQQQQQQPKKSPAEELIRRGLEGLFGR
jgi:hypothetical protein